MKIKEYLKINLAFVKFNYYLYFIDGFSQKFY
jgi:hypothetical protein